MIVKGGAYFTQNNNTIILGSLDIDTGAIIGGSTSYYMRGAGTSLYIKSGGKDLKRMQFDGSNGAYTFMDDITLSNDGIFMYGAGNSINFNGKKINVKRFYQWDGNAFTMNLTGTDTIKVTQEFRLYNSVTFTGNPVIYSSIYTSKECCKANNGTPTIYPTVTNGVTTNNGYVCCVKQNCGCNVACKWSPIFQPIYLPLNSTKQDIYMEFIKEDGSLGVTTPDGSHCLTGPNKYTEKAPNITDPYTGEVGYACQLNEYGLNNLSNSVGKGSLFAFYNDRYVSLTSCFADGSGPSAGNIVLVQ